MVKINMDFVSDWEEHLKSRLLSLGYKVNDDRDIGIQFFNAAKRYVSSYPRKVYCSKEFTCEEKYQKGLSLLIKRIEEGKDITKYLTRNITKINHRDLLLNDWNIHHLHLGEEIKEHGFIERTGPVLFVWFERTEAYLINVYDHGNWENIDLIRIIHNNWSHLIKNYRMEGITGGIKENAEVKKLRKYHSMGIIEISAGINYLPIGMGMTLSGDSIEAVRIRDFYMDFMSNLEDEVRNSVDEILAAAIENGINITDELNFALEIEGNDLKAKDNIYNITLDFGQLP